MKYSKYIVLKDGTNCQLRAPQEEEAEQVLEHLIQTSGETEYLARNQDEIHVSLEQEKDFLRRANEDPRSAMIAAFVEGILAGNVGVSPVNSFEKYRHRAEMGLSVKKAYWGRGIGTALMEAAIEFARAVGYEQIELEVMGDNSGALSLYKKLGFTVYGTRMDSFRLRDGRSEAAFLMVFKI